MRAVYLMAGLGLCGLGILGAFLPVMPSTIFFILALPCFTKSSPKMESWLLTHPRFGPTLVAWSEDRSIASGTKTIAVAMIWISITATVVFFVKILAVRLLLLTTAVCVSLYILTRKTRV